MTYQEINFKTQDTFLFSSPGIHSLYFISLNSLMWGDFSNKFLKTSLSRLSFYVSLCAHAWQKGLFLAYNGEHSPDAGKDNKPGKAFS